MEREGGVEGSLNIDILRYKVSLLQHQLQRGVGFLETLLDSELQHGSTHPGPLLRREGGVGASLNNDILRYKVSLLQHQLQRGVGIF